MTALGLILAAALLANVDDTSTGLDLSKLPHPAMTRLRATALQPGEQFTFGPIQATATQSEVVLTGKSKSGRPWTAHFCDTCVNAIHRLDLDGNGTLDYVITGASPFGTPRNAPAFSLAVLLMDSDDMPLPFFTLLYDDGGAPQHLVKFDGKIRLLIPRYDEIPSNSRVDAFCSGHWTTQAYGFEDATVEEVRGTAGGLRFPFIRNWSYSDPECAHNPIGITQGPKLPDLGTSVKNKIAPPADCPALNADAVLLDTTSTREIAFPSSTQQEWMSKATDPEIRGLYGDCRASLLWARPRTP